jgi:hypothetical protein
MRPLALSLAILLPTSAASAQPVSIASQAPGTTAQYGDDLMPRDEKSRADLLKAIAFDATIYGMSAYLQYEQLYRQVFDKSANNYTGYNRFYHERDLAGPDYQTFKVPNADTLYSTAWIDLSQGPIEVQIPATSLKYYTLNIFDIFGNPTNLSSRTVGFRGGRFLVVPPGWTGTAPQGPAIYRATSMQLWILMRSFAQSRKDVDNARTFQNGVTISPPTLGAPSSVPAPPAPAPGAANFLRALDYILRANGNLPGEDALVARFRSIGVGNTAAFDGSLLDTAAITAIESGYRDALTLLTGSKSQLGTLTDNGWLKVNKGQYGFNYVRRSVTNTAGLGANVREENASYTAFVDGSGKLLDGTKSRYRLHLTTPPPVDAFWSVTLYDAKTFALYPNPLRRYLVSDRTPGLKIAADGSIDINIQHEKATGNWLPAPSRPFFVVLRAYSPKAAMLNGGWLPPAIMKR